MERHKSCPGNSSKPTSHLALSRSPTHTARRQARTLASTIQGPALASNPASNARVISAGEQTRDRIRTTESKKRKADKPCCRDRYLHLCCCGLWYHHQSPQGVDWCMLFSAKSNRRNGKAEHSEKPKHPGSSKTVGVQMVRPGGSPADPAPQPQRQWSSRLQAAQPTSFAAPIRSVSGQSVGRLCERSQANKSGVCLDNALESVLPYCLTPPTELRTRVRFTLVRPIHSTLSALFAFLLVKHTVAPVVEPRRRLIGSSHTELLRHRIRCRGPTTSTNIEA